MPWRQDHSGPLIHSEGVGGMVWCGVVKTPPVPVNPLVCAIDTRRRALFIIANTRSD